MMHKALYHYLRGRFEGRYVRIVSDMWGLCRNSQEPEHNSFQQFSTAYFSTYWKDISKTFLINIPFDTIHKKVLLLKRTAFINVEVKSINVFRTERRNAGQQFYNSSTMKNVYFNILKTVYATNAKKTICFENLHENNSENRANNRIKT